MAMRQRVSDHRRDDHVNAVLRVRKVYHVPERAGEQWNVIDRHARVSQRLRDASDNARRLKRLARQSVVDGVWSKVSYHAI